MLQRILLSVWLRDLSLYIPYKCEVLLHAQENYTNSEGCKHNILKARACYCSNEVVFKV